MSEQTTMPEPLCDTENLKNVRVRRVTFAIRSVLRHAECRFVDETWLRRTSLPILQIDSRKGYRPLLTDLSDRIAPRRPRVIPNGNNNVRNGRSRLVNAGRLPQEGITELIG